MKWIFPPYYTSPPPPLVLLAWPNWHGNHFRRKRMHTIQSVQGLNIIIIMIQMMTVTGYASSPWHVARVVRFNTFGWRLRIPAVVAVCTHSCKTSSLNPPIKHTHTQRCIVDHKASGKYLSFNRLLSEENTWETVLEEEFSLISRTICPLFIDHQPAEHPVHTPMWISNAALKQGLSMLRLSSRR